MYFCFREVLRNCRQQPKTPKYMYILEVMFATVPSKMAQKWAKISVLLVHKKKAFLTHKFINPYKDLEIKRS